MNKKSMIEHFELPEIANLKLIIRIPGCFLHIVVL